MVVGARKPVHGSALHERVAGIHTSAARVRQTLCESPHSLAFATECKIANFDHRVKSAPTTM